MRRRWATAGGKPPSYNVRIAVDADTGIVVHHNVTDEVNDLRMLHPMAVATRDLLGCDTLKVVADTGYSNGNAAAACEADGIVPCVPAMRSVNNRGDGDQFDRSRSAMVRSTISTHALLAGPCTGRGQ